MTLSNMNITIDDLVACKPETGDVPFFDGTCRGYHGLNQTSLDILTCMIGENLGIDSLSLVVSPTNDITIDALSIPQVTASLIGTMLTVGDQQFDLSIFLNTSYFISDGYNNYEILNHQTLRRVGLDGLHFNVGGGDIEIGLPTPASQYFVPGRCTLGPIAAYYSGRFAGITTIVTIVADNAGSIGNITLTFTAGMSVNDAITDRNVANPANTITLTNGNGAQEPGDGEYIQLRHGADANTCQPTDYMPFNKWLVLTRDCVTNQSQWMPIQCCPQQISFDGTGLTINTACDCSLEVLYGINTDNQELSINGNDLCLTARHGGTLGNQIPDLPSCVDLIDVAKKYLSIDGYQVSVSGGNIINLGAIGHLNCIDVLACVCEEKIDRVAAGVVPMISATGFVPQLSPGTITPADWGQIPAWSAIAFHRNVTVIHNGKRWIAITDATSSDEPGVALTVRSQRSNSLWPDDAREVFLSQPRSICETRAFIVDKVGLHLTPIPPVDQCTTCGGDIITCNDCYDNYGDNYPTYIQEGDVINNSGDNCYNCNNINTIGTVLERQKFRARIYPSSNRTIRSGHEAVINANSRDGGNYARWYFPDFDQGQGRTSQTTDMVNDNPIVDSLNHLVIGALFDQVLPHSGMGYSTTKSGNNPNDPLEGKAANISNGGGKTITIPMNGWYNVELAGTIEVDHNVNAYRYSVLKLREAEAYSKVEFLLDTKFGGDPTVGSHSVNNIAYPETKQYTHSANKMFYLKKGDILFVAVRIDPVTYWTRTVDQQGEMMTGAYTGHFASISHTPGSASACGDSCVSWSAGSLTILYNNQIQPSFFKGVSTLEMPRPASFPPHLQCYEFYGASGGSNGAQNYDYRLGLTAFDGVDYRYDDGCIKILANPSFAQSDGSGSSPAWFYDPANDEEKFGGAMLSVHRVNYEQQ